MARMGSHASSFPHDVRASLDAFRRIVQALRTSSRHVERHVGLSSAQLFALQQLALMPGASVNDLAARTFTHQSSVSVVVRRLVEQRLVAKMTAQDDRRRLRLALTEHGRAVLRRSPSPVQEQLIAGIASLPDAQRQMLAESLAEIAHMMSNGQRGPAPMLFEDHAPTGNGSRRPRRGRAPARGARRKARRRASAGR